MPRKRWEYWYIPIELQPRELAIEKAMKIAKEHERKRKSLFGIIKQLIFKD